MSRQRWWRCVRLPSLCSALYTENGLFVGSARLGSALLGSWRDCSCVRGELLQLLHRRRQSLDTHTRYWTAISK
ncbi:unnamed protein product [Soboliphyme baturini]|uniref:Secreted protein n=1 Tax=Soboliphyme baturini TaxID=241478 RepID=A0A183IXK8_9BILA|nr:unnamed protein product [Soboliphyme baturini]